MIETGRPSLAIVYNPRAGGLLRRRRQFDHAVDLLRSVFGDVRLVETGGPGTAGPLARDSAQRGAEVVVACGGDGTINEIVQSLSGTGVPLGILPGGTANVLSNEIGVGNDMVRAAHALERAVACDVATGLLRQGDRARRFLLMAGIGFDARLVHELALTSKERWGKLAYWGAAIRAIRRPLDEFEMTVDGQPVPGTFAIVSRVRNYGGDVEIARGASLLSDDFEVVSFRTPSVVRLAWLLLSGTLARSLRGRRDVTIVRGRTVTASSSAASVLVQVDGEAAGSLPASVGVEPASLRLMLPRAWVERERAQIGSRPGKRDGEPGAVA